jgi:hypothetical protein
MFYEFAHRHTPCTVDGVADIVILSRESKGSSVIGKESMFAGRFAPTSLVQNGSLVVTDDYFLVQTKRKTPETDLMCSLIKTNTVINVQRYSQAFDANDNPIGDPTFTTVAVGIKAFAQYVTAHLRQQEPGLLPTTVYTLDLQTTVDIKRPQDTLLHSPDRVILNGHPYQVDVVDDVKYPNLFSVQLSEDLR